MDRIHDFHHVIRVQLTITTIIAIILNELVSHSEMSLQMKEQLPRQINKQMGRAHFFLFINRRRGKVFSFQQSFIFCNSLINIFDFELNLWRRALIHY